MKAMSAEQELLADEPVRLKIEHRAYEIWVSEGSPNGCDLDHWLRAEAEVTAAEPEGKPTTKSAAQVKKTS